MVELLIKISEEIYEDAIRSGYSHQYDEEVAEAVAKGIKLPKVHGKLVEINSVHDMAINRAKNCFPDGRYNYGYRFALFEFAEDVDGVPAIIEANDC